MELSFTAADAIRFRDALMRFMRFINPSALNLVKAECPAEDVCSDCKFMIELQMLYAAADEVKAAASEVWTDGKPVIRREAKRWLSVWERKWGIVKAHVDRYNNEFLYMYADLDDEIGGEMRKLTERHYWPLVNNALKTNRDSAVCKTMSHLMTAHTLLEIALLALRKSLGIKGPALDAMRDSLEKLTVMTVQVMRQKVEYDDELLESQARANLNFVENRFTKPMEEVYEYALTLDLTDYVAAADMTLEDFLDKRKRMRSRTVGYNVGSRMVLDKVRGAA